MSSSSRPFPESAPAARALPRVRLAAAALLLLVLLVSLSGGAGVTGAKAAANPTDTILVKFKTGASEQAIEALNKSSAVNQVDAIPALGIRVLRVPAGKSAGTVAGAYARNPLVQFAEVNALIKPEAIPNDPNYGSQWHIRKIRADVAWDTASASGVLIGICDTGVEPTHPDLQAVLRGDLGWNTANGTNTWANLASHGTMVAGAAAAAVNNATGVAGVASGAKVIPVRISNFTDGSAYISDAAKCIQYSADQGARSINLSYRMAGSATIDTAASYARSNGALTFVAAGNDGTDPGWPNYPSFLAVSATTTDDTTTSWSNFGAYVDLAAPGNNVWTTKVGASYGGASGTSLASPVAAGVAALLFGANPTLTPAQAESILRTTAVDAGAPGNDSTHGSGRVDAAAAVLAATGGSAPADTTAPSIGITSPSSGSTVAGSVTVSASASDNVGVTKVEFFVDGVLKATDTASPYSHSWDTTGSTNGSHSLTAKAFDAAGNNAHSAVVTVTVSNLVPDTTSPTAGITSPAAGATVSGTVNVAATASDNVGVARVEFYVNGVLKGTDTSSPYGYAWETTASANGSYSLTAKAFDAAGNSATSASVSVTVSNVTVTSVTDTFTGSVGGRNALSKSHSVVVRSSGPMTVRLTWGGKANLDVAIYDSAGVLVSKGVSSSNGAESATTTVPAGTYRVVVTAVSGKASYTLSVTHY